MNRQNKVKDILYIVFHSLILVISVTLFILLLINNSKISKTNDFLRDFSVASVTEITTTEIQTQPVAAQKESVYILGVKDGRLAIYASDGYTLIDLLDTYVYSLPQSDREAVSQGIEVYSVSELVALIQDYTS